MLGPLLISWQYKKQSLASRSTAQAEYRAFATSTCELVWLTTLLKDLGHQVSLPISVFCDNEAAIHITSNPVLHFRTKHIKLNCHFIREKNMMGSWVLHTYLLSFRLLIYLSRVLADSFIGFSYPSWVCKICLPF